MADRIWHCPWWVCDRLWGRSALDIAVGLGQQGAPVQVGDVGRLRGSMCGVNRYSRPRGLAGGRFIWRQASARSGMPGADSRSHAALELAGGSRAPA